MIWDEVRKKLPHTWVVIEAIEAHNDGSQRIITRLDIAANCGNDPEETIRQFSTLSRFDKNREYYPLHTDREQINIRIQTMYGRIRRE